MEELLKQIGIRLEELGVRAETWIISLFAAILFVLYRIYEPETPPTRRRIVSIVIMGFISALLVPGLIVHWFNIGNPFVAASITGITVFGFESIVAVLKKRLVNKLDDDGDK